MVKKTNISANSLESYEALLESGIIKTQESLTYLWLIKLGRPATRREIANGTGLEIGATCRTIYNLLNKSQRIKIDHTGKCKLTQKTVNYYSIIPVENDRPND